MNHVNKDESDDEKSKQTMKYFLKIFDTDKLISPRTTVEFRGFFKCFGGIWDGKLECWIIDVENLEDIDILHFRRLVELVSINQHRGLNTIIDVELWEVDSNGKSERLRSFLNEIKENLYPDGKLSINKEE